MPGLARALTRLVPDPAARSAVHKGATSQDIIDTAAMLLASDAIDAAPIRCRARPPPPHGWPTRTGRR